MALISTVFTMITVIVRLMATTAYAIPVTEPKSVVTIESRQGAITVGFCRGCDVYYSKCATVSHSYSHAWRARALTLHSTFAPVTLATSLASYYVTVTRRGILAASAK